MTFSKTAYGVLSKNPPMTAISKNPCIVFKQKSSYGIQAKVFYFIKPLIFILESSKDDETKTQITSVIQMLCSTNLDIIRLRRVFAAQFFKPDYKSFLKLPITQQPLFVEVFDKLSEKIIKEQSSIYKVLKNTSSF